MQLIAELEPTARGLYGGTVGYFAKNGNMDQAITIRTLVQHGDEYSFQAGGGRDDGPRKRRGEPDEGDEEHPGRSRLYRPCQCADKGAGVGP